MAIADTKIKVSADTKISRAVLELSTVQSVLAQLDVKSSRTNLMNLLAVQNSVGMVIQILTASEDGGEKHGN